MTAGTLPAALLCAALGLILAFSPRRTLALSLSALTATALLFASIPFDPTWSGAILLGCWISVLLTAVLVYVPGRVGFKPAMLLGVNAGVWSGATIGAAEGWLEFGGTLPWALLGVPGGWVVARGGRVGLKVLASWLIAVAILGAALPMITTPAYAPDHMG